MPRASLVIPTRNRARVLARTLAALRHQTEPDFEVVVADDGSDDDTPEVVRTWGAHLDLRYLRRAHRGIAAARSAASSAGRRRMRQLLQSPSRYQPVSRWERPRQPPARVECSPGDPRSPTPTM